MNTYNFVAQNRVFTGRGRTEMEALCNVMDKNFTHFYGPVKVGESWEIYSDMGTKITLTNEGK